ncbi:MAG: hypothetical protein ACFFD4_13070 [Candidatus Odinarchaeota archaeon]
MTDQDEIFELVQVSLKVMAKDIGERLKEFDQRIARLEQAILELSSGTPGDPSKIQSFEVPRQKEGMLSVSPDNQEADTPDTSLHSSTTNGTEKDDKKKKDLLDAIKIIDSL